MTCMYSIIFIVSLVTSRCLKTYFKHQIFFETDLSRLYDYLNVASIIIPLKQITGVSQ